MKQIDCFELRPIEGNIARSALLWHGEPIALDVDGILLERQYCVELGYLLFLTDDCPYEEGLHIYLLNAERLLLDALELGAPYTPAILDNVIAETETALTFSFFGNDQWRLDMRRVPRFSLHYAMFSPLKYKRRFLAKRWLDLRRLR
jgi:hypothetical protein